MDFNFLVELLIKSKIFHALYILVSMWITKDNLESIHISRCFTNSVLRRNIILSLFLGNEITWHLSMLRKTLFSLQYVNKLSRSFWSWTASLGYEILRIFFMIKLISNRITFLVNCTKLSNQNEITLVIILWHPIKFQISSYVSEINQS